MTLQIFILDDLRTIKLACKDANFKMGEGQQYSLVRPFHFDGMKVLCDLDDARAMIINNPPFDVWILDNDLGPGVEGYDFLKGMIAELPDKIPSIVKSCSANYSRKVAIEALHNDWMNFRKSDAE